MINELKLIVDSLESTNINLVPIHRDITQPGGTEALRVLLGDDKTINNLEYVYAEKLRDVLVIRADNQDQFPNIKLTKPLRPRGNSLYATLLECISPKSDKQIAKKKLEDICKREDEVKGELLSIVLEYINNKRATQAKLAQCFLDRYSDFSNAFGSCWPKRSYRNKICKREKQFADAEDADVRIIHELYRRYLNFDEAGVGLLRLLDLKAEAMLRQGCNDALFGLLMKVLFGSCEVKKTNGEIHGDRVILILDYLPDQNIDIFATANTKRRDAVSSYLIKCDDESNNSKGICPILGEDKVLINGTFPKKNLGKGNPVSQISFYSKFQGNGSTVERYHKSGTNSYTIGEELSRKFGSALELLVAEKNKDKTWCSIPSEGQSRDLLVAYCHASFNLEVTQLISGKSDTVEDFEDYCSRTTDLIALFDKGDLEADPEVDFFVFRRISDGAQKVMYSAVRTLSSLKKARNLWVLSCRNVPDFKLKLNVDKTVEYFGPWILAPIQITYLSSCFYKWDRGRLEKLAGKIPAISFKDTMTIFFDINNNEQLLYLRCLKKLVSQSCYLFDFCGRAKLFGKAHPERKQEEKLNRDALKLTTLIGALLCKLNRTKEIYMKEFSYQLGQLCSAIDELHIGYCEDVRGGNIPNVLIGNMVYGVALQDPKKALDILASRLKPYYAWAKRVLAIKNIEKQSLENALYAYLWIGKNASRMLTSFSDAQRQLPATHKAELMLGYLAGRPFEKSITEN